MHLSQNSEIQRQSGEGEKEERPKSEIQVSFRDELKSKIKNDFDNK